MSGRTDQTVALLAGTAATAGPLLGEWAFILLGSVVGALCAISTMEAKRWAAFWFMLRSAGPATMMAGTGTYLIAPHVDVPISYLFTACAFVIAWKWDRMSDAVDTTIASLVARVIGRGRKDD